MIENAPNTKHRCIIGLLYSAGLRMKELLGLEADQSLQKYVLAANAKERKLRSLLE